ncbi:unnamed protein product [Prunus brigantina]
MNQSKALKVTHNNGDPGLLSSASKTSYTNIICTLLDSCNFVLQEFSFDGSGKRVLWQSFDLSEDTPFLLWNFNAARDTIKLGDTLNSSSSSVSAMGKFTMRFHRYNHNSNYSYLVIQSSANHNYAWIANRNQPILHPLEILTLDQNKTLKITHEDGDPVVFYSAYET